MRATSLGRWVSAIYRIRNFAQRCTACVCVCFPFLAVCVIPGGDSTRCCSTQILTQTPALMGHASETVFAVWSAISSRVMALALECNNAVDDHISLATSHVAKCAFYAYIVVCVCRCMITVDSIRFPMFDNLLLFSPKQN